MKMSELRVLSPELADIIEQLGPNITRGAIYIDGRLVHGKPPTLAPGEYEVTPETYEKMREYATKPLPTVPRMPRKD